MGVNPKAETSAFGLPRARALYGSLPEQLKDPDSFASRLKQMLAARKKYRIAEGELVAVPDVANSALCLLVMRLQDEPALAITALNFGQKPVRERLDLRKVEGLQGAAFAGQPVIDSVGGEPEGKVDARGVLNIELQGWSGKTLIIEQQARGELSSSLRQIGCADADVLVARPFSVAG
jgi:maltose alpha-D-glucosyltransferase/alpha-amylase